MKKLLALAILILLVVACGSPETAQDKVYYPATADRTKAPRAWPVPAGYKRWDNEDLVWRWLDKGDFKCRSSRTKCWGMEIISRHGCQSLYVEITILDSDKYNIGWTNDTASGVRPMEKAILIFDTYEDNAKYARPAEINCR